MKKFTHALVGASLLFPALASAQLTGIAEFLDRVGILVEGVLPIVMGIAVLAFLWGLAKFIYKAGDTKAQDEGKNIMKWGIIALFVMVSAWGIINFIGGELGIGQGGEFEFPTIDIEN